MTITHSGMTPKAIKDSIKLTCGKKTLAANAATVPPIAREREQKVVVGFVRWLRRWKTWFHISKLPSEIPSLKYATCTLLNSALTWWNSHKRTIGTEAAFAMSWRELTKLMTEVYCTRNEIQKMESEL
ncbi:hypothetical protein Tco_0392371 [Tanacetum coccineum]